VTEYLTTLFVAGKLGIHEHLLQRWVAQGVVQPTERGLGTGNPHRWTWGDIRKLRPLVALHRANVGADLHTAWQAQHYRRPGDDVLVIVGDEMWLMNYRQLSEMNEQPHVVTVVKLYG
jgi:hypothetical protein